MKVIASSHASVNDPEEGLCIIGQRITLLHDPEKALSVNEGRSLVPWSGDNSLLIDRFDCRAHLTDLSEQESAPVLDIEDYLSDDDITIEKMCEFERYLELQLDVDEMSIQEEEAAKRGSEKTRGQYGAVDFSYDPSAQGSAIDDCDSDKDNEKDDNPVPPEEPYTCPPELQGHDHQMPETDKQAQIIEKTAVFVARQGNQMEIVLKAKQTGNPLFGFLNYDHDLNPFYKLVVKLIRQGRYIPKFRPAKCENLSTVQYEPYKSIDEDVYELKLPKVDISKTAYASLINKFKKFNEIALQLQVLNESNQPTPNAESGEVVPTQKPQTDAVLSAGSLDASVAPTNNESNSGGNSVAMEEYEQCYQEYYKHYYTHYYSQFSEQQMNNSQADNSLTGEQQTAIVNQAAKAAAVAASAAVNAMHQARTKKNTPTEAASHSSSAMTNGEKAIIDKMAEYVTRNGPEFEELVVCQKKNDPRFGFLNADHPFHEYYLSRRRLIDPTFSGALKGNGSSYQTTTQNVVTQSSDRRGEDCSDTTVVYASPSSSPTNDETGNIQSANSLPTDRSSSISFRVSRPTGPSKLRASTTDTNNISTSCSPGAVPNDISVDLKPVASCPTLQGGHSPPASPIHIPSLSLAEQQQSSERTKRCNRQSNSPVRFSLPGIACAYSSDSAPSSPDHSPVRVSPTPSPKPVVRSATPSQHPDKASPVANCVASPVISRLPTKMLPSPSPSPPPPPPPVATRPSINNKTYARPSRASVPRVRSPDVANGHVAAPLSKSPSPGEASIEEMLDMAHKRSSTVSPFAPSNSSSASQPTDDEQLQLNRRKRAALLVARLKQATLVEATPSSVPPPPAPDSVPAAVAHAVVASLKRRHEAALTMAEKERKKHRSPPAAYALPRSSKSTDHESSRDHRDSGYYRQKKHLRY